MLAKPKNDPDLLRVVFSGAQNHRFRALPAAGGDAAGGRHGRSAGRGHLPQEPGRPVLAGQRERAGEAAALLPARAGQGHDTGRHRRCSGICSRPHTVRTLLSTIILYSESGGFLALQ